MTISAMIRSTLKLSTVFPLLAALALPAFVEAAIPHSKTIVSRLAKNSGRGVYVVEQEVRFSGPEGITLKERWLVQNSDVMRLIVQDVRTQNQRGDFRWDALYRGGRRIASVPAHASPAGSTEPGKAVTAPAAQTTPQNTALSGEFFESFLFHRTSARFFESFVKNKILPPSALRERARIGNIANYKPTAEPAVRLGRTSGVVAWVFGEPTPIDHAANYPGAWIEQDNFILRKIRLPSQAEMTLGNHQNAGRGLRLPRERTITWHSGDSAREIRSATIKVTSARAMAENSLAPQFQPASITPGELKAARLPDSATVREFYSRFR
ncbi:MAG: hypothetical protein RBT63_00695 [Bdellovibrionales bacterium]|jgi:hypothetical protein|nr:hypothetical protein [Bdellovibrionales bacterium]